MLISEFILNKNFLKVPSLTYNVQFVYLLLYLDYTLKLWAI
jgi:hypothetical protein